MRAYEAPSIYKQPSSILCDSILCDRMPVVLMATHHSYLAPRLSV